MSEKRFKMDNESDIIEFDYNTNEYIQDFMWADGKSWDRICNRLNELYEENEYLKKENQELNHLLKKEIDLKIEYKKRVKEILQKYFDKYTKMAMELRHDQYSNSMCHDVTEVIFEIADKLWIDLDLMGFKND